MQEFDIALIVTVEADSYENALFFAEDLADGVGNQEELSVSAVTYYEHDKNGKRIVRLHPENPRWVS